MIVTLFLTKGPAKGKVFTFTEHDTFLFGRVSAILAGSIKSGPVGGSLKEGMAAVRAV